jgi:hypothetical protein
MGTNTIYYLNSVLLSIFMDREFVSVATAAGRDIYMSTLLFYYIHMMMVHLCQTPPNMSSIGAVCDSLG